MVSCDLCGVNGDLYRTVIESVEMKVCHKCSRFGKVQGKVAQPIPEKQIRQRLAPKPKPEEITEEIVSGYGHLIRKKREQLNVSQKEFAHKINQKESVVHSLEAGRYKPSIELARKLEKILGLRLVETVEETADVGVRTKREGLTMGDFIKIKK